jgi:hypothetical protein
VKQKDSFIELIKTAIATGATIPEQLRPAVERLIEMGLVTDADGNKLEGLERLTFAETLDAKFGTLIDTINRLASAIERTLTGSLAAAEQQANETATAIAGIGSGSSGGGGTSNEGEYGSHGGVVTPGGLRYLTGGGFIGPFIPRGADVHPAMLSTGEGVLSTSGMDALGRLNRGLNLGGGFDMGPVLTEQRQTTAALGDLRRDLVSLIPTLVERAARHGTQTRTRRA